MVREQANNVKRLYFARYNRTLRIECGPIAEHVCVLEVINLAQSQIAMKLITCTNKVLDHSREQPKDLRPCFETSAHLAVRRPLWGLWGKYTLGKGPPEWGTGGL